ncbi:MAG: hypothetical protein QXK12_00635 [Candidatus Nezhaarchaeales archaeon]
MSLLEQVERVLIEHPEVIVKALEVKPGLIYELLIKLTPWNKLATKEDLKLLIDLINRRFEDVNKRFEDLRYYVDRRIGFLEKLIVGLIVALIKLFALSP